MSKMDWIKWLLTPCVLILLGLVLIFCPDSAAALLVQIIGWLLIAVGAGFVAAAVANRGGLFGKLLAAAAFLAVGGWMVHTPLSLAEWIGRFLGVLLMIQGIQDILYLRIRHGSLFLPILTAILGAVLVVLPMTTSRLVFSIIGGVVLVIGIVMLIQRIRLHKLLQEPDDPNIIDAL